MLCIDILDLLLVGEHETFPLLTGVFVGTFFLFVRMWFVGKKYSVAQKVMELSVLGQKRL